MPKRKRTAKKTERKEYFMSQTAKNSTKKMIETLRERANKIFEMMKECDKIITGDITTTSKKRVQVRTFEARVALMRYLALYPQYLPTQKNERIMQILREIQKQKQSHSTEQYAVFLKNHLGESYSRTQKHKREAQRALKLAEH